jgi:hypothetical protein
MRVPGRCLRAALLHRQHQFAMNPGSIARLQYGLAGTRDEAGHIGDREADARLS